MRKTLFYFLVLLLIMIILVCSITIFYISCEVYKSFKLKQQELHINYLVKLSTSLSLLTAILIFVFDKIKLITYEDIIYFIIFCFILAIYSFILIAVYNAIKYFKNKNHKDEEF